MLYEKAPAEWRWVKIALGTLLINLTSNSVAFAYRKYSFLGDEWILLPA